MDKTDRINLKPSSDLTELLQSGTISDQNKKSKARPKSYAEPSTIEIEETKRRSYQEATEGQWERAIIDRIVANDNSNQGDKS